jgi:uncharacterized protein with beta-barrel porin domain
VLGRWSVPRQPLLPSNIATASIGGVSVGADVWLSHTTVAGFVLAGGGTSFSVTNGGSGRSDLFQAGAFIRHNVMSAYITAALAYGWQGITTDRTVRFPASTACTQRTRPAVTRRASKAVTAICCPMPAVSG